MDIYLLYLFRLEMEESMRPQTPRNITTLRIKSETGNHTYILKMKFTETIGDLKKYLDLQRFVCQIVNITQNYQQESY